MSQKRHSEEVLATKELKSNILHKKAFRDKLGLKGAK